MNTERWRQIEQLYHEALQQEPDHRESFLAAVCRDDEGLRRQVADLLKHSGSTLTLGSDSAGDDGGARNTHGLGARSEAGTVPYCQPAR